MGLFFCAWTILSLVFSFQLCGNRLTMLYCSKRIVPSEDVCCAPWFGGEYLYCPAESPDLISIQLSQLKWQLWARTYKLALVPNITNSLLAELEQISPGIRFTLDKSAPHDLGSLPVSNVKTKSSMPYLYQGRKQGSASGWWKDLIAEESSSPLSPTLLDFRLVMSQIYEVRSGSQSNINARIWNVEHNIWN